MYIGYKPVKVTIHPVKPNNEEGVDIRSVRSAEGESGTSAKI